MTEELSDRLLDAAAVHVPFEGWSDRVLEAAAADCGVDLAAARAVFPRGGVGLAVAWHARGDRRFAEAMARADLGAMRYSEKVAHAVRLRIEAAGDREVVRRGAALFALPQHSVEGVGLIWKTADLIWELLGDTSTDVNWYTKRATLSGVYSSTVLYWLGDESPGAEQTWAYLDRRIADVMRVEKLKADIRASAVLKPAVALADAALSPLRAPRRGPRPGYPGKAGESGR